MRIIIDTTENPTFHCITTKALLRKRIIPQKKETNQKKKRFHYEDFSYTL